MRICIDSCVLINALQGSDPAAIRLLNLIGSGWVLLIPRLIAQEVTRNLQTPEQVRHFYRLFFEHDVAFIVDDPVPRTLVDKYVHLGLPEKADAYIGAFAEWMQARYLVSDNRHFIQNLRTNAFDVLDAGEFMSRWDTDSL